MTSTKPELGWQISEKSIKDFTSIPGRILSPLYSQESNKGLFHLFYNDEHPNGQVSFTKGHTKGCLAFNQKYGFWLIHSVPKFPPKLEENTDYDYPHTGQMYGQSFLCISLHTNSSANQIGLQLMYNRPYIYSQNLPKWVEKNFPVLANAAKGETIKKSTWNILSFKSLLGRDFISFAKNEHFGEDLYSKLVAPKLKMNMMAETWPNGPGKMNSSCSTFYHVLNIDSIDFRQNKLQWATHKDHAKWAVTYGKTKNKSKLSDEFKYVCIGDINRMESQKKRGGGTVCFHDKLAWKAFSGIVNDFEACPKPN